LLLQQQEAHADLPAQLQQLAKDRQALDGERAALQEARQELDHQVKVRAQGDSWGAVLVNTGLQDSHQVQLAEVFGNQGTVNNVVACHARVSGARRVLSCLCMVDGTVNMLSGTVLP
jgi:hypothetical protein